MFAPNNTTSCDALDLGLGVSCIALYSLLFLVVLVLFVRMLGRDRCNWTVPLAFLGLMFCFLGLRVSYFVLKTFPVECVRSVATFVLNRFSFCFYFTGLVLVLFYWAEQAHRTIIDDKFEFLPGVKRWFAVVVGSVWIYQLIVLGIWVAGEQSREDDLLYDSNILIDECLAFVLANFFFAYGVRLFIMMRRATEGLETGSTTEARLYLFGAFAMLFLFLVRVIVFLWRFVTSTVLPNAVFYAFGYVLPELLPAALHTYVMRQRKRAGSEGKKFIEDLYAQQNSEEIASFLLRSEATADDSFVRRDLESPAVVVNAHSAPSGQGSPIVSRARGGGLDSDFEET